VAEGFEVNPDSPRLQYSLARVEAAEGNVDAALAALRAAMERRPELGSWALEDPTFASVRDSPEFRELVGQ
jgi:hypothetical protein